ncbi:MAG: undecaprenyl-diphosphate phosphatase [Robiginitomaculum sp.]|nr:MAG: undecaprenyl-diphosphate phosphatase [Robiginitomaculum sp.]
MDWLQLLILAIVQGLTEFLPVSSSAHLILPSKIMNWPDQGPMIDLMAHLGSLGAVLIYYRRDVGRMIAGGFDILSFNNERMQKPQAKLAFHILIATPPALITGLTMSIVGWDELVRSPLIIAWAMIGFGVVLWLSDIMGKKLKTIETMNWKSAVLIGLAQMIAFIPGTSRSGITMTAARALGYTRSEAARFSMLLAIPTILAGGAYAFLKLLTSDGAMQVSLQDGLIVAALSLVAAYIAIYIFMKLIEKVSFFPFMIYRFLLGGAILYWLAYIN